MALSLTATAAQRIKSFVHKEPRAVGLRVGIKTTGCSGFAYVTDLAHRVDAGDSVFESHGVRIVVDAKSLSYLDGTEIDFRREGLNEGFHYDNPNVKSLCGCGESFAVDQN